VTWIHRLRLRVFAWLLGIGLAGVAIVSWLAVPAWPVFGVAVAVVVATVSTMTSRLSSLTCLSCGSDLTQIVAGEHGRACPSCGSISRTLAKGTSVTSDSPFDWSDSESDQT
jgi:DNA-directed RNA polymerase subunit RPC12/RpoP